MKTSPTQRSLKLLRKDGYSAFVVEHWNQFAHIRQDFAGFADILAFRSGNAGVLAVQTTSRTNQAARLAKLFENPHVATWLRASNRVVVHGWKKCGPRGARKLWECSITPVNLEDCRPVQEIANADELFQQAL